MASLNTLRTKYGIVLSVLIALVLVAFILGDQLSMRGGQQESTDEVVLTVNGEEIRTKEFSEAYQATGNEADARLYVIYEHFFGPELEKIGLGTLDDEAAKRALVQIMSANGEAREDIINTLNNTSSMGVKYSLADHAITTAVSESFHLNLADLTAFEAQKKLSYDGRFVRYPYSAIEDSETPVSDEEVREYYDSHILTNTERGARSLIYVEFPHAVIPQSVEVEAEDMEQTAEATETAEVAESEAPAMPTPAPKVETDPNSVTDAVNDFKEAAKGDADTFRQAAADAGLVVNTKQATMAERRAMEEYMAMMSEQLKQSPISDEEKRMQFEQMYRMVFQLMGSHELAVWAYNVPAGLINSFVVDGKTYVVMVESVDENEYIPFEEREMDIRTKLINAKKYDIIAETMTIGDDAEKFEGVRFDDTTHDAHLVGAICALNEVTGDEVKVKGNDAAYIFVVDKINGELGDVKSQAVSHSETHRGSFVSRIGAAYSQKLVVDDMTNQQ